MVKIRDNFLTFQQCQEKCKTDEFKQRHKVLTLIAEIEDKDKPNYHICKWCDILVYSKNRKLHSCWCCNKPLCKVYKKKHNGKYYEY